MQRTFTICVPIALIALDCAGASNAPDPCAAGSAASVVSVSGKCNKQVDSRPRQPEPVAGGSALAAGDQISCGTKSKATIRFCRTGADKLIAAGDTFIVPHAAIPPNDELKGAVRRAEVQKSDRATASATGTAASQSSAPAPASTSSSAK